MSQQVPPKSSEIPCQFDTVPTKCQHWTWWFERTIRFPKTPRAELPAIFRLKPPLSPLCGFANLYLLDFQLIHSDSTGLYLGMDSTVLSRGRLVKARGISATSGAIEIECLHGK